MIILRYKEYVVIALLIAAAFLFVRMMSPASSFSVDAVKTFETQIVMPSGASELSAYSRYYAATGNDVVTGVFLLHGEGGMHIVSPKELPSVQDGGCAVVTVRFDIKAGKILGVACNAPS